MRRAGVAIRSFVAAAAVAGVARADPPPLAATPLPGAAFDRTTVYLARPAADPGGVVPPLLSRELQRQALLIAARDELGLYTRDEVFREFDSAAPPPGVAALKVDFDYDPSRARLGSRTGWDGHPMAGTAVASVQLDGIAGFLNDASGIGQDEVASRTSWPQVLRQAGFTGTAAADNDGPAPAGVDDLLYQTTLFAPLAAVQRTHAAIRRDGASPERLSALARGYANLAVLTSFQWSTNRDVFAARALLYGQRMATKWPHARLTHWTNAYALAMVGMHRRALAEQERTRQSSPGWPAAPPWAELVVPLAKYDTAALTAAIAADPRRAPLAALCAFVTVEQCGSAALVLDMGGATSRLNPACFRILDAMSYAAGVGPGARLTEAAPLILSRALPDDVVRLADVPAPVAAAMAALRTAADRPSADGVEAVADPSGALAAAERALVDAGSTATEPSLVVAGRLAQETSFVHVERRAKFIADRWGIDAGDFVRSAGPLMADDPLRPVVEAFALPSADRASALRDVSVPDARQCMVDLIDLVRRQPSAPDRVAGSLLSDRAWQDGAATACDVAGKLWPYDRGPRKYDLDVSNLLRAVSPSCPMVAAARIRDHWDDPQVRREVAPDWMAAYGQQPATLAALADRVDADGDRGKAEQILEQYTKIAGDVPEARRLAKLYLADGDEDRWLATLEGVVKRPDLGLDHAQAQVDIARHFMSKGDYQRALPYADEAEQTQAFWAMKCDAECHRALGDTATADRIMADAREHYGHD